MAIMSRTQANIFRKPNASSGLPIVPSRHRRMTDYYSTVPWHNGNSKPSTFRIYVWIHNSSNRKPLVSQYTIVFPFLASHFVVFCDENAMTAVFERADLPKQVNIDRLHLRSRQCRATYNSTHVFIKTPLTSCGTLYEETDQTMFFSNTLSEEPSLLPFGDTVSRNYLFQANFTCSYGRKRTVGTVSFKPARQRLSASLSK